MYYKVFLGLILLAVIGTWITGNPIYVYPLVALILITFILMVIHFFIE